MPPKVAATGAWVVVLLALALLRDVPVLDDKPRPPLELPKTTAGAVNAETQPITISINKDGKVFLQETEIEPSEVAAKLSAIAGAQQGEPPTIFVRGDLAVRYDVVARVLADVSSAGFKKITLTSLQREGR